MRDSNHDSARAPTDDGGAAPRWAGTGAAATCVAIWVWWWLALWPALMTEDSLDQWYQVTVGRFTGQHAPFHTMLNWVVTRLWHDPAALALVQILALGAMFGATITELRRWHVPRAALVAITLVFALSPVNGLMTVTLWKDVPYSVLLLGVFLILLRAVRTSGVWLITASGALATVGALAGLALFRHNGPFVVALILSGLVVVWPKQWRALARTAVLTVTVVWVVRGPVESAVGVQPMSRYFMLANQTHQIAAIVRDGADITPPQAVLLSSIMTIDQWRSTYNCYSVMPTFIAGAPAGTTVVEEHLARYLRVYRQLVLDHPVSVLKRQACITSLVWRVDQPAGSPFFTFYPGIVEFPNSPRPDSKLPGLRTTLLRVGAWTQEGQRVVLFWRPAGYLYLTIVCIGLLAWRSQRPIVWVLLLPVAAQSIVLLLLNTVQDFRLQYGVYLIALPALVLPLANAGWLTQSRMPVGVEPSARHPART